MADATLVETEIKLKELQSFRNSLKKRLRTWEKVSRTRRDMGAEFCELIELTGERHEVKPEMIFNNPHINYAAI